jgi:hypothetical protein
MTMRSVPVLTRSLDAVHTEVNPRKGMVRAIISDDSTDRYKTIFDPHGCDWDAFMRSGAPVLYEHGKADYRLNLPVGNVEEIERTTYKGRASIIASTRFWDTDEFAKSIKEAYLSQKMRGWSINAFPRESSPPTAAEKRARGDWANADLVYRDWELIEVSAVTIPGNANTLTTEVIRSLGTAPATIRPDVAWAKLTAAEKRYLVAALKAQGDRHAAEMVRLIREYGAR